MKTARIYQISNLCNLSYFHKADFLSKTARLPKEENETKSFCRKTFYWSWNKRYMKQNTFDFLSYLKPTMSFYPTLRLFVQLYPSSKNRPFWTLITSRPNYKIYLNLDHILAPKRYDNYPAPWPWKRRLPKISDVFRRLSKITRGFSNIIRGLPRSKWTNS